MFNVWIANSSNDYVSPIARKDGSKVPLGTITVKDSNGKLLATLPMAGGGYSYGAGWKITHTTRGKFHVEVNWTTTLFGHLYTTLDFERR